VLTLSADDSKADLNGSVTLENKSRTSYENAPLRLSPPERDRERICRAWQTEAPVLPDHIERPHVGLTRSWSTMLTISPIAGRARTPLLQF
jgi:hypothetical protein